MIDGDVCGGGRGGGGGSGRSGCALSVGGGSVIYGCDRVCRGGRSGCCWCGLPKSSLRMQVFTTMSITTSLVLVVVVVDLFDCWCERKYILKAKVSAVY